MSIKINKNGKEYPLGFVPQSLYDDVEDLKESKTITNLSCNNGTFGASKSVSVRGKMAYIEIVVILTDTSADTVITVPDIDFEAHIFLAMNYQGWGATDQRFVGGTANGNTITIAGGQLFPYLFISTTIPLV